MQASENPAKQPTKTPDPVGFEPSRVTAAGEIVPAIRREKLMIERISLVSLVGLWSMATVVALVVSYVCVMALTRNIAASIAAGVVVGGIVAARGAFWIRKSVMQWRRRYKPPQNAV